MPYESIIDAAQILRSTLHLLQHTDFPEKNSLTIQNVVQQLQTAIADLGIARTKIEAQSDTPPLRQDAARNKRHR